MGFLKFHDIFRNGYTLGFCTVYDLKAGRFVMRGDERYNYHCGEGDAILMV
jgi:hypothetical protein